LQRQQGDVRILRQNGKPLHIPPGSCARQSGAQLCSTAPLKSIDHEMLAGHEHMRLDG
jgi:hypothetical protein